MSDDIPQQLSIKQLLDGGVDYIIPMYQRNFAWDEGEITQLIQDVIDYIPDHKNYYIGTLVVYERYDPKLTVYETIDGQQRLTTLSLLASYLKNRKNNEDGDFSWYEKLNIHFESREHSRRTFEAIFEGKLDVLAANDINTAILNGYELIKIILPQKLNENKFSYQKFSEYLFENVQIMRVKVPHDTELNHYFEIMNSRGEQLEKHEILKSLMLEVLNKIENDDERKMSQNCFHVVWEACSNMERYVQMGFTPTQRNAIFGDKQWSGLMPTDFDKLHKLLNVQGDNSAIATTLTLSKIIEQAQGEASNSEEDNSSERFNSVINFPNFLLHVLRVMLKDDIPLDDKRLLKTFETFLLGEEDRIDKVKKFTFSLLKSKYLFDRYVIKREFIKGTDGWSLKRFKRNEGDEKNRSVRGSYVNTFDDDYKNRRIVMLLSAFHVSTPTLVYKHWLNAALYYLYYTERDPEKYLSHLESTAKAFVFDRFLAHDGGKEYFEMIYTNKSVCQARREDFSEDYLRVQLSFGNIKNNLVFNYLDYLLWLDNEKPETVNKDRKISAYEFTFRSSVEHYFPQNPMPGHTPLSPEILNLFGNLCLISHSKNSRLSNFMPRAKREYYQSNPIDSVKQHLMMKFEDWNKDSIAIHYEEMKNVLLNSI